MRNFFNSSNPLLNMANKLGDAAALSLLWVLGTFPIVTLCASSNALYETFKLVVIKDEGNLLKTFWTCYKKRIKKSIFKSIIYEIALLSTILMVICGYMYFNDTEWIGAVYLIMIVFCAAALGMMMYSFLLLQRIELTLKNDFKIAFFLIFKHLPTTVLLLIILMAFVVFTESFPYGLLFTPAALCWLTHRWIESVAECYPKLFDTEQNVST